MQIFLVKHYPPFFCAHKWLRINVFDKIQGCSIERLGWINSSQAENILFSLQIPIGLLSLTRLQNDFWSFKKNLTFLKVILVVVQFFNIFVVAGVVFYFIFNLKNIK